MSSNSAKEDFKINHLDYIDKVRVVHFVSQPSNKKSSPDNNSNKYISGKFFYLPNQFWAHKNHIIVFKALKILKEKGIDIQLVTSGLMQDYRKNNHIEPLLSFVKENNLSDNIKFLGLIPYVDVLQLIKDSIAVINPSLFEGWSSTVEESKSVGKLVILSNILVHIEQSPRNSKYFDPNNEQELALILEQVWNTCDAPKATIPEHIITADLEAAAKRFADTRYILCCYN